jgi:AraC family ethanolamine operon transcriptional activator
LIQLVMTEPNTSPRRANLSTSECEELNSFSKLNAWQADYQQLGGGAFESRFKLFRSASLSITDQYCNRETAAVGVPPAQQIPLFLVLNRGNRGIFNGRALKENEAFVMRPGSEGCYRTPSHLRMINLQIPQARLREALGTMADKELDQIIPDSHRMTLPENTITRLTGIAESLLGTTDDPTGVGASGVWQREAEEYLISVLVSALGATPGNAPNVGRRNRMAYVNSARDYIEAHLDSPLGLETLARETGVTLRTLEIAFREYFDTTPLRYVKMRRLHAARRRLLKASGPGLTVSEVAMDYGFTHQGYFARDYRSLFGESPSETLRPHRATAK